MDRESLKELLRDIAGDLRFVEASGTGDEARLAHARKLLEAIIDAIPDKWTAKVDKAVREHSILEWQGLGKELWRSINVDEYIREERESWERVNSEPE